MKKVFNLKLAGGFFVVLFTSATLSMSAQTADLANVQQEMITADSTLVASDISDRIFTQQDVNSQIIAAINSGNAKGLAVHFNTSVDLTVPGSEGVYSKAQAEIIIKDFFTKNPPASFTLNHEGGPNEASQFIIGTLKSGNKIYRTYYLIKSVTGVSKLHQLKFELSDK